MAPVTKDILSLGAVVSALMLFFVFASNKWIADVEASISHLEQEAILRERAIVEIRTAAIETVNRLDRIEGKLDRALERR